MEANDGSVFTEHVPEIDRNTTEIPAAVRRKLAARLRKQLCRRGLFRCSASTFGYSGKTLGDAEVFDELLNDAYIHLFWGTGSNAGKQLEYLRRQVKAGNQIDRLIQFKLSEFIHDLHRNAFPTGAGIHKNVKAAAKQLDEDPENEVTIVGDRTGGVNSDSVLGTPSSGPSLVEGTEVDSICAVISGLSANPIAILFDDEVGSDPDYIEWIDALRLAVDALLDSLHNEESHSVRLIGLESVLARLGQSLSLAADDSVTPVSDSTSPSLLQRLQVFDSVEGSLQACLYGDGVIVEWHPAQIDSARPLVAHDATPMEWVSQETFWCTHLISWSDNRLELSVNDELRGFIKPQDR